MKKSLLIFLLTLLVLVGLPYAWLALSGGPYDSAYNPEPQEPMSPDRRFLINSADKTIGIRIDKNDLFHILYDDQGKAPLDAVNSTIGEYGLEAKKLGVDIDDNGLHISMKFLFKRFLPLPLRCDASFSSDGSNLLFSIDKLTVASLFKINPSFLTANLDFSYDLEELNPIFQDVRCVTQDSGSLLVTIPYPLDWVMEGIEASPSDYVMISDFVSFDELDTPVQDLFSFTEGDPSGILARLDAAENCPEKLCELKTDILAIVGAHAASIFFGPDAPASSSWLFPTVTKETVDARRGEIIGGYQKIYDDRIAVLDSAYEYLHDCYADGRILVKNGVLVHADTKGSVKVAELGQLQGTDEWLDIDTVRIALGENPGDFPLRGLPGKYTPVLLMRTRTGRPVVCLRKNSTVFLVQTVDEKDYVKYMAARNTPVHDIGIFTTQR